MFGACGTTRVGRGAQSFARMSIGPFSGWHPVSYGGVQLRGGRVNYAVLKTWNNSDLQFNKPWPIRSRSSVAVKCDNKFRYLKYYYYSYV